MAAHSRTLAWKIPRTEEPGGLQSTELGRVDTTEQLHFHFHVYIRYQSFAEFGTCFEDNFHSVAYLFILTGSFANQKFLIFQQCFVVFRVYVLHIFEIIHQYLALFHAIVNAIEFSF